MMPDGHLGGAGDGEAVFHHQIVYLVDRTGKGVLHRYDAEIGPALLHLTEHIGEALHELGTAAGEQAARRLVRIGAGTARAHHPGRRRSRQLPVGCRQMAAQPFTSRQAAVLDGSGRLTGFNEKSAEAKPGTINGGVYLMKRALLDEIPAGKVSLENEMIPKWLSEGRALGGFVNDGYFIDIGIPEAYYQFIEDVEKGVVVW